MALSKITADSIAANAVSATMIADGSITNAKLGSDIDASKLVAGTLPIARIADGAVTAAKLASGAARTNFGAGAVLQVVQGQLGSGFSATSTQTGSGFFTDVTGMAATITPSSSSSTILVMVNMYVGATTTSAGYQQHIRVRRGTSTYPFLGTAVGGRPRSSIRINMYSMNTYSMQSVSGCWLDSPASTSAQTYQIEMGGYSSSPIIYVNRSETWQYNANDYDSVPLSTITLMEIAG